MKKRNEITIEYLSSLNPIFKLPNVKIYVCEAVELILNSSKGEKQPHLFLITTPGIFLLSKKIFKKKYSIACSIPFIDLTSVHVSNENLSLKSQTTTIRISTPQATSFGTLAYFIKQVLFPISLCPISLNLESSSTLQFDPSTFPYETQDIFYERFLSCTMKYEINDILPITFQCLNLSKNYHSGIFSLKKDLLTNPLFQPLMLSLAFEEQAKELEINNDISIEELLPLCITFFSLNKYIKRITFLNPDFTNAESSFEKVFSSSHLFKPKELSFKYCKFTSANSSFFRSLSKICSEFATLEFIHCTFDKIAMDTLFYVVNANDSHFFHYIKYLHFTDISNDCYFADDIIQMCQSKWLNTSQSLKEIYLLRCEVDASCLLKNFLFNETGVNIISFKQCPFNNPIISYGESKTDKGSEGSANDAKMLSYDNNSEANKSCFTKCEDDLKENGHNSAGYIDNDNDTNNNDNDTNNNDNDTNNNDNDTNNNNNDTNNNDNDTNNNDNDTNNNDNDTNNNNNDTNNNNNDTNNNDNDTNNNDNDTNNNDNDTNNNDNDTNNNDNDTNNNDNDTNNNDNDTNNNDNDTNNNDNNTNNNDNNTNNNDNDTNNNDNKDSESAISNNEDASSISNSDSISCNFITCDDSHAIVNHFADVIGLQSSVQTHKLKELDLEGCSFTRNSILSLFTFLTKELISVSRLNLSFMKIEEEEFDGFIERISDFSLPSLKMLAFNANMMNSKQLAKFDDFLLRQKKLKALFLSGSITVDENNLKSLKRLLKIIILMDINQIGLRGAGTSKFDFGRYLAKFLKNLSLKGTVLSLDITNQSLTEEGIETLILLLNTTPIQEFYFDGISTPDIQYFVNLCEEVIRSDLKFSVWPSNECERLMSSIEDPKEIESISQIIDQMENQFLSKFGTKQIVFDLLKRPKIDTSVFIEKKKTELSYFDSAITHREKEIDDLYKECADTDKYFYEEPILKVLSQYEKAISFEKLKKYPK